MWNSFLKDKWLSFTLRFKWTGYTSMEIYLTRIELTEWGIFGRLSCEEFGCVSLERHDIAVPAGRYKVTLYNSPIHGLVPLLHEVPGRSFIEIHAGNWEKDSKGCILIGADRAGVAIEHSKATLKDLLEKLKGQDEIWLTTK